MVPARRRSRIGFERTARDGMQGISGHLFDQRWQEIPGCELEQHSADPCADGPRPYACMHPIQQTVSGRLGDVVTIAIARLTDAQTLLAQRL